MPGVFLQGLLIYNASGHIVYDRCLEKSVVGACIQFAAEHKITLAAYCGDRILAEETDVHTDRLTFYSEPTPEGAQESILVLTRGNMIYGFASACDNRALAGAQGSDLWWVQCPLDACPCLVLSMLFLLSPCAAIVQSKLDLPPPGS
jgi:hypothetical protein